MAIIDVGGVQGSGKSSLLDAAQSYTEKQFTIVKRSDILAKILNVEVGSELSVDHTLLMSALEEMRTQLSTIDNCARDIHYSTLKPERQIYPVEQNDIGRIAAAVLVTAPIDILIMRRRNSLRGRTTDPIIIQEQLMLEEQGAKLTAQQLGVPLLRIINENFDIAAQNLAMIIDKYLE